MPGPGGTLDGAGWGGESVLQVGSQAPSRGELVVSPAGPSPAVTKGPCRPLSPLPGR